MHCDATQRCLDGLCVQILDRFCFSSFDCGFGYKCSKNQCSKMPEIESSGAADCNCEPGFYCRSGLCIADPGTVSTIQTLSVRFQNLRFRNNRNYYAMNKNQKFFRANNHFLVFKNPVQFTSVKNASYRLPIFALPHRNGLQTGVLPRNRKPLL